MGGRGCFRLLQTLAVVLDLRLSFPSILPAARVRCQHQQKVVCVSYCEGGRGRWEMGEGGGGVEEGGGREGEEEEEGRDKVILEAMIFLALGDDGARLTVREEGRGGERGGGGKEGGREGETRSHQR